MSTIIQIKSLLDKKLSSEENLTPQEVSNILKLVAEASKKIRSTQKTKHSLEAPSKNIFVKVNSLTKRQYHIFILIGKGLHSKQIAEELHISLNTVTTHRKNIIKRLKLKGTGQLQRIAQKHVLSAYYQKNTL